MAYKVSVAAPKGGVGKTTSLIALAISAAEAGKRVLLVDMDDQGSLSGAMGRLDEQEPGHSSYELMMGDEPVKPHSTSIENIKIVPASLRLTEIDILNDIELYHRLGERVETLFGQEYDIVFYDTPGNISMRVTAALTGSDFVYSPLELSQFSVDAFETLGDQIQKVRKRLNANLQFLGFLPNRVSKMIRDDEGRSLPYVLAQRKVYNDQFSENPTLCLGSLCDRTVYQSYLGVGRSISESDDKEAKREIKEFAANVFSKIGF